MKAEDARQLVRGYEDDKAAEARRNREAEIEKQRDYENHFIRNLAEKIKPYLEQIESSAKCGGRSVDFSFDGDNRNFEYEQISKQLMELGYRVEHGDSYYVEGQYENMGDTEAPCNIWQPAYWWFKMTVRW